MFEELTEEEAENLKNYFAYIRHENEKIEQSPDFPINEDYCWMHDGENMGGWTCQHPECRDPRQEEF